MPANAIEPFASARVPTEYGNFVAHAYRCAPSNGHPIEEHVAYVMGDVAVGVPPLVRLHSECLTGDIFSSLRCDCGQQLRAALKTITTEARGVLIYLRGHEGRGIGIGHKLRAYALQDAGLDTVEANEAQGLPVDARSYGVAARILTGLGVATIRLMTNNPHKLQELENNNIKVVERVPIEIASNPENALYLATKRDRLGHSFFSGN